MTTATGDFAINFAVLGDADPYTNANFSLIDTGFNFKILTNVLRPSNGGSGQFGLRRWRYTGTVTGGGATLESKIELGNGAGGDEYQSGLLAADGSGYLMRGNQTSVSINTVDAAGTYAGLISGTAGSAASGDVLSLRWVPGTNTLTVFLNGVAVSGSGPGGLLAVVDSTYTSGLAHSLGFDAQNASATTIASWAGDGITITSILKNMLLLGAG